MSDSHNFGAAFGFIYIINCTIGAGFLCMPWAYQHSGILFSAINQVIIGVVLYFLSMQYLALISRCDAISRIRDSGSEVKAHPVKALLGNPGSYRPIVDMDDAPKPEISDRRIDACEMIKLIYGQKAYVAYSITYVLVTLPSLAAYVMLFSASFAANVPLFTLGTCNILEDSSPTCRYIYTAYGLMFCIGMLVLTLVGFAEQKIFQLAMGVARFIVFSLFYVCALHLIFAEKEIDSAAHDSKGGAPLFNAAGMGLVLPITWGSSIFLFNLPEVANCSTNRATTLPKVLKISIPIICVLYCTMGITMAIAVDNIADMASIEFEDYTGGFADRHWWAWIIGYIIVLFPALDICSIFPLLSINLADNVQSMVWGHKSEEHTTASYVISRVGVCIPAFVVGLILTSFSDMFIITGIILLVIAPLLIPIMSLSSKRLIPDASEYDCVKSNNYLEFGLIVYAIVLVSLVIAFDLQYYVVN